jgi:hypothetical protein
MSATSPAMPLTRRYATPASTRTMPRHACRNLHGSSCGAPPGPHEEHFLETPAKPPEALGGSLKISLVQHPVYFVSTKRCTRVCSKSSYSHPHRLKDVAPLLPRPPHQGGHSLSSRENPVQQGRRQGGTSRGCAPPMLMIFFRTLAMAALC